MKTLILTLILLVSAFTASAQSLDFEKYKLAAVSGNDIYYVDYTSIGRVSTGNITFWTATTNAEVGAVLFMSTEVNCKQKRLRFRGVFITNGKSYYKDSDITNWFPRTEKTANQLIKYVC